jgi:tetratricopeptide (TPR) repeat protein
MKKISLIVLSLFTITIVNAQSSKVNSAYASYNHATSDLTSGDMEAAAKSLAEAAAFIEPAITDEKTMVKSKTWRYRGNIYSMISGIESMHDDFPDATDKAIESYNKAMELDTKGSYKDEITQSIVAMYNSGLNDGIEAYSAEEYEKAIGYFQTNIALYDIIGIVDTMGIYNSAISADLGGKPDIAVEYFLKCADMGYEAEYSYNKVIVLLNDQEKYDEALEISKVAREQFPQSQGIIIAQLNVYLNADKYEEAERDLEQAANANPNDANMWFALGVVKENLKKSDEAAEAYKKSLAIDPEFYNSNMNLAILYFTRASDMINAANEIPVSEIEKYEVAKEEAMVELRKAVPYFEKSNELRPGNKNVLLDLKEAYGQLNDTENYTRIKEILDNI